MADGHELLTKDYSCDIALPRIKKRLTIESIGALEPRKSALEDDFEEEEEKDEDDQHMDTDVGGHEKDHYREQSPTRERGRDRKRDSHRNSKALEKVSKSQAVIDAIGDPITKGSGIFQLRAVRNAVQTVALKEINYIALGTVYKTDGKQMLHNKELPKDCYKVSVDKSLVDAACIPNIGNNGFKTVKDAVGTSTACTAEDFDTTGVVPLSNSSNIGLNSKSSSFVVVTVLAA
ncbi:hypothetical protein Tco_0339467 [Tanacetum coccineum]